MMKTSEVIGVLKELKDLYGDIDVSIKIGKGNLYKTYPVEYLMVSEDELMIILC